MADCCHALAQMFLSSTLIHCVIAFVLQGLRSLNRRRNARTQPTQQPMRGNVRAWKSTLVASSCPPMDSRTSTRERESPLAKREAERCFFQRDAPRSCDIHRRPASSSSSPMNSETRTVEMQPAMELLVEAFWPATVISRTKRAREPGGWGVLRANSVRLRRAACHRGSEGRRGRAWEGGGGRGTRESGARRYISVTEFATFS